VTSKYVASYAVTLHSRQIMKFVKVRVIAKLNHWRRVSGPVCGRSAKALNHIFFHVDLRGRKTQRSVT